MMFCCFAHAHPFTFIIMLCMFKKYCCAHAHMLMRHNFFCASYFLLTWWPPGIHIVRRIIIISIIIPSHLSLKSTLTLKAREQAVGSTVPKSCATKKLMKEQKWSMYHLQLENAKLKMILVSLNDWREVFVSVRLSGHAAICLAYECQEYAMENIADVWAMRLVVNHLSNYLSIYLSIHPSIHPQHQFALLMTSQLFLLNYVQNWWIVLLIIFISCLLFNT